MNKLMRVLKELDARALATGLQGLQEFAPVQYLDDYARRRGGGEALARMMVAPQRQIDELGEAYARMPDMDERALPAWRAMTEATERQFDDLTRSRRRGGLGVDVTVTPEDPFDVTSAAGLREMLDQLADRRLQILSTKTTGGHPLLTDEQNDMFRAVHDAFGHGATGRGFGSHGEEAAFRAHAAMYPREAMPALAAELRAQNAFLNKFNTFGPQKVGFVPEQFARLEPFDMSDMERAAAMSDAIRYMKDAGRY